MDHETFLYISQELITDFDNMENNIMTIYKKGPLFVNKGQPLNYRDNVDSGKFYHITFQFIPDYRNKFEATARWEESDIVSSDTETFIPLYTVPFDQYVEMVEVDISATFSAGDNNASIYLVSLKKGTTPGAMTLLSNYSFANIQGGIIGANRGSTMLPSWIHDVIQVGVDAAGTANQTSLQPNGS